MIENYTDKSEELMKYIRDNFKPTDEQDTFISVSLISCIVKYHENIREDLIKEMENIFGKK